MAKRQIGSEKFKRQLSINRESVNVETRTVELSFASEEPVDRYFGVEVLDCTEESCDLTRLNSGANVLFNHNWDDYRGVILKAWVDPDRKCRARILFSENDFGEKALRDVAAGVLGSISVGYWILAEPEAETDEAGNTRFRVKKWQPYEISLVTVPADVTVGVGRTLPNGQKLESRMEEDELIEGEENEDEEILEEEEMMEDEEGEENEDEAGEETPEARAAAQVVGFARSIGMQAVGQRYTLTTRKPSIEGFKKFALKKSSTPIPVSRSTEPQIQFSSRIVRSQSFKNTLTAYKFAQWFRATGGDRKAIQFCRQHGVMLRAQTEGTDSKGGFLVPVEFLPELIVLQEQFGVAPRYARIIPMSAESIEVPKLTEGFEFTATSELQNANESDLDFDQVKLTAKDFSGYTEISSNLSDDAAIVLADALAAQIARAAALKKDQAFFNGDGTSTYNGILGVRARLRNPELANTLPTISHCASLVVASGNAWDEFAQDDFLKLIGRLPEYAEADARFYCSKTFYSQVMERIMLESGGVPASEVAEGRRILRFLGYEVVITQVLPKAAANSAIPCIFGALNLGAAIGDRQDLAIATDYSYAFRKRAIAVRADMRFDVNVYAPGNVNSDEALQEPGPILGLISAAS